MFCKKWHPFFLLIIIFLCSCNSFKKKSTHKHTSDGNIAQGKIMAATYCQSCFLLTNPSLLDSKHCKEGVLAEISPHSGIFFYGFSNYFNSRFDKGISPNFYPDKQVLSFVDWQNIIDYYAALSPDTLSGRQRKYATVSSTALFKIVIPAAKNKLPATCLVKIDTTVKFYTLMVADMMNNQIFRFDNHL